MRADRLPSPFRAMKNRVINRVGAFSTAMSDASIPALRLVEDTEPPLETNSWRHPVHALRQFVGECVASVEIEFDDEAWIIEGIIGAVDERAPAGPRSDIERFAEGLGIVTMRGPSQ